MFINLFSIVAFAQQCPDGETPLYEELYDQKGNFLKTNVYCATSQTFDCPEGNCPDVLDMRLQSPTIVKNDGGSGDEDNNDNDNPSDPISGSWGFNVNPLTISYGIETGAPIIYATEVGMLVSLDMSDRWDFLGDANIGFVYGDSTLVSSEYVGAEYQMASGLGLGGGIRHRITFLNKDLSNFVAAAIRLRYLSSNGFVVGAEGGFGVMVYESEEKVLRTEVREGLGEGEVLGTEILVTPAWQLGFNVGWEF